MKLFGDITKIDGHNVPFVDCIIGGFSLIWEQINGKGACSWASEIEEFPIAVTKHHFGERK